MHIYTYLCRHIQVYAGMGNQDVKKKRALLDFPENRLRLRCCLPSRRNYVFGHN
jgi:hypothetical protein